MNNAVRLFLERHRDLLIGEDFDSLYTSIEPEKVQTSEITEALLDADINPLDYLHEIVPFGYAVALPISSITIPEGFSIINTYAFYECSELITAHLPESLISIGQEAFSKCTNLLEVNFPDRISKLGRESFQGCYGLKNIKLPDSLVQIDGGCFFNCEGLESVTFGDHLEAIGKQAFGYCSKLSSLIFPGSLEDISTRAFTDCDQLEELTFLGSIPPKITGEAFWNCPIKTIYFDGTATTWKNSVRPEIFSPSTQIQVICRDGRLFKNKDELKWSTEKR